VLCTATDTGPLTGRSRGGIERLAPVVRGAAVAATGSWQPGEELMGRVPRGGVSGSPGLHAGRRVTTGGGARAHSLRTCHFESELRAWAVTRQADNWTD